MCVYWRVVVLILKPASCVDPVKFGCVDCVTVGFVGPTAVCRVSVDAD